ncbi:MAG TPA: RHS repeat-associated core domain-containing protein [Longimicrobium sp.]|jgi:RHS repeat-associated protein|uniref:RHS repeat-associated core domain-containing protein n=1 Tax=Longimicrobium sp. TaxID=2029185 RepID=UPI002ED78907
MPLPRFPTDARISARGTAPFLRRCLLLAIALAATLLDANPLRAQACALTREDAVKAIYVQVLEREGDPGGLDHHAARLHAGTSVRDIVWDMAQSPEYRGRFITGQQDTVIIRHLYRTLLARSPDPGAWVHVGSAASNGWNYVISQLVNSPEYTDRFGDRAVPGEPIVAWDCTRAGLALEPASAAPVLERDLCLTIAAGSGAYECGDLRLAHALPTIRTLNKARTPVLIYNQAHVDPHPIVAAYVSLPAGVAADSVSATLLGSNGGTLATGKWPAWTPGQERRIALLFRARDANWQTGAHGYTLQVRVTSGASTVATYSARGEIGVVDRQASAFGAGWWLAGLEKLHFLPDGRIFWVGGDGSYRTYRPLGTTPAKWAATHVVDRPDTLYTTTHPYSAYERRLPGGTRVIYNGSGHHVTTINLLNHQTNFGYSNEGRLGFVSVPLAPGYGLTHVRYNFVYGGAGGRFSGVTSTDLHGNPARATGVSLDAATGRVLSITDPGLPAVQFEYHGGWPWWMSARVDRRGTRTRYGFNGGKLVSSTVEMDNEIRLSFTSHETRGLAAPEPTRQVYTRLDGPRVDVPDTTAFHIDRWGAPRRIVNALGHETVVTRGDSRLPALVTRVRAANGLETSAEYNARGNVVTSTVHNPLGDGQNAITSYLYDPTWPDFVSQITTPEKEVVRFGYHTNGLRAWEHPGTDMSRRVYYGYNALQLVDSIDYPVVNGQNAAEVFRYDQWGNLQATISPSRVRTDLLNDELGRVIRTRTPIQGSLAQVDTVVYDVMDRVRHAESFGPAMNGVQAQTLIVENEYDEEGRLTAVSRSSAGNEAQIGTVTTRFYYDRAGRTIAEVAPDGMVDSTFYDPSGNAVRTRTRRHNAEVHDYIRMEYDELNRLTRRILPEVRIAGRAEGISRPLSGFSRYHAYPRYPTSGEKCLGSSTTGSDARCELRIPADVVEFRYDDAGNLIRADNRDAQVRRGYYPNGLLKTDTLRVRTAAELSAGGDFAQHDYTLGYRYDLNGRRTALAHPGQLAPAGGGDTQYRYHPETGALETVIDPLGNAFTFAYNTRGETESLLRPGGITERYRYRQDGRLDQNSMDQNGAWLRAESMGYDLRGKLLSSVDLYGSQGSATFTYSGLGHVLSSDRVTRATDLATGRTARHRDYSESRTDALANLTSVYNNSVTEYSDATGSSTSFGGGAMTYQQGTGRLLVRKQGVQEENTGYDRAGNIVFATDRNIHPEWVGKRQDRASFFDAEGRLRATDLRRQTAVVSYETPGNHASPYYIHYEEYRYDALGRRIWVRVRRECTNDPYTAVCSRNDVRRVVWDGDAELYEIQMPGTSENDTNPVADQGVVSGHDLNLHYGRVLYTYGQELDKPVSVIRMLYADKQGGVHSAWPVPFTLVPHWNVRGQAERGTFANGAPQLCRGFGTGQRCVVLDWPQGWFPYSPAGRLIPENWHGTLITEKQDASGLLYRRNRYYDPATGRFTQEDPIGLAGGLNVYGFANGDPVTYSDPYGLCPKTLRLAPAAAADGPVPAVDAVLATACVVELGIIGFRWYRTARAAEVLLSTSNDDGQAADEASAGNSPENAPGQTAGGRATDEHGNVLGPSGRPAVHQRNHPTRKRAQDAARNEGQGPPVHHPNPTRGDPHFHPADRNGNKLPTSTHHNYPRP